MAPSWSNAVPPKILERYQRYSGEVDIATKKPLKGIYHITAKPHPATYKSIMMNRVFCPILELKQKLN